MSVTPASGFALLRERREEIRDAVARRRGTGVVRVFGSVARGDDAEGSDIDLLVEFEKGASLFDQAGLEIDLEELLGRRVDVMSLHAQGRAADRARETARDFL
ncbi:nucleotidyltransferase family protein [uncultured Tessaracoccus sp.]|uniref:nucleotidyltransferase family protein n=1 Tax=uncultured Tessaracoccus sp. TaxID=905023 RepID=UPI0026345B65|nr:nucleotidyltransferase family protein [uncultured Tessaracoccus sp.]